MSFRSFSAIATAVLALTVLCYRTGLSDPPRFLGADDFNVFADGDGDMVPTCIELLARTDPRVADTDADRIDDFEEILTFTNHTKSAGTKPVDHAMRILVTSVGDDPSRSDVYLHLLVRFVNLKLAQIAFQGFYADVAGVRYPLMQLLGTGPVRVQHRERRRDGTSFLFSVRLSSEKDLRRIMPCTIGAIAVLGGKYVNTGCYVMANGQELATLMPFTSSSMIIQPVNSQAFSQDGNPFYRGGGRVCEVSLSPIGVSSHGTICEVDKARCIAAPGLRCTMACPGQVGNTVVIPGGPGALTGN